MYKMLTHPYKEDIVLKDFGACLLNFACLCSVSSSEHSGPAYFSVLHCNLNFLFFQASLKFQDINVSECGFTNIIFASFNS